MTRRAKTSSKAGVTPATVRRLLLRLPGVEEGTSYGMPSFKVAGKFFARLRDDDTVVVVHLRSLDERDRLLEHEPVAFFTTDHYRNYPTVLIRLAAVSQRILEDVLKDAWHRVAPRRLVKEHAENLDDSTAHKAGHGAVERS
jgi:hypothetical protein